MCIEFDVCTDLHNQWSLQFQSVSGIVNGVGHLETQSCTGGRRQEMGTMAQMRIRRLHSKVEHQVNEHAPLIRYVPSGKVPCMCRAIQSGHDMATDDRPTKDVSRWSVEDVQRIERVAE